MHALHPLPTAPRSAVPLVLTALVLALLTSAAFPSSPARTPDVSANLAPPLLQFTAGGHVVGFAPTQVVLAALDHALRVEFIGTTGTTPTATAADKLTMTRSRPLDMVTYSNLWPGVSVEYRASAGGIAKSTYTVAPGADPAQIRLRYSAPTTLQRDGSLRFSFGHGSITESAPIAWQDIGGRRTFVPAEFYLLTSDPDGTGHAVGFRVGAYDLRYPLTIDPTYVWHTFYGSNPSTDYSFGVAVDGNNNVYVAGSATRGWNSGPGGVGGMPPIHAHTDNSDIVVVKLNSSGVYQWHTFYGSTTYDRGDAIAVDGNGNVYVTGQSDNTWQGDGGANALHVHSGGTDIVVLKLSTAGAYQWHTFYGSAGYDAGDSVAVDSNNVYITGSSYAAWQGDGGANPIHAYSGAFEIVALKLTSAGAYQWHTFYGSASEDDFGLDIAVDGSSNVYIAGSSYATWQGDGGASPLRAHSGSSDIVVLKLTSAGVYQWHTFYGSSDVESGYGIAVDGSSNVYITGESWATWLGPGGAAPLRAHSGSSDIVILKLTGSGAYQWHTFYGSSGADFGEDIAVQGSGNLYVTGGSDAGWLGAGGAPPLHAYSGDYDIVALKLSNAGTYQWHTFYGSSDGDSGYGIALNGTASEGYITGYSVVSWLGDGNTAPLNSHSGNYDIFVLKLAGVPTAVRVSSFRAAPILDPRAWLTDLWQRWSERR